MKVTLLVVRHAIAVPHGEAPSEAARPLTPAGRRAFSKAVEGLKAAHVRVDRIFHSPLLRAVETAELLWPLLDSRGETEVTPLLAEAPTTELLALLRSERPAVVGHQPWLGELCSLLVTGSADAGDRFALDKGGVARLEGTPKPGRMELLDFWSPDTLARLTR